MATSVVQELLRDLQLNPEFQSDAALQQLAQTIQTELFAWNQQPRAPIPAPPDLPPEMQTTWNDFQVFHQLLLDYSGWANRDQWLHLEDVAADLLTRGPQGDSPVIGNNGNWWVGGVDTGVPSEASAPYIGPNGNWFTGEGVDTGVHAAGPPGPPGVPGTGLLVLGSYPDAASLNAAHPSGPPQPGGTYLVGTPPHLYVWSGTAWVDVGPFTAGIGEAPSTTQQGYVRNGLSQSWVLLDHNGGTF